MKHVKLYPEAIRVLAQQMEFADKVSKKSDTPQSIYRWFNFQGGESTTALFMDDPSVSFVSKFFEWPVIAVLSDLSKVLARQRRRKRVGAAAAGSQPLSVEQEQHQPKQMKRTVTCAHVAVYWSMANAVSSITRRPK